jgi:proton glutamate symport protein
VGFKETLVGIVPDNLFSSLADGNILPIIFFAVMFGLGVAAIGEKGKPILKLAERNI